MDLETNRSLEGELRFSDLILSMLSEGPRDVYFQESGTTRPFSSKEHWNLYRTLHVENMKFHFFWGVGKAV